MSASTADDRRRALRRGARRELEAAKTLGTTRIQRGRSSAPDVRPVKLPCGRTLGPEVKTRKRLPKLLVEGLAQARRYFRGATIPLVVVSELGGSALAVLELRDLVALLGVDVPIVARPRRRGEREPKQLGLALIDVTGPWKIDSDASTAGATSETPAEVANASHTSTERERKETGT